MKQAGILNTIEKIEGTNGYNVKLKDYVANFYLDNKTSFKIGDKVILLYRIDKSHGFFIEKIEKYIAPELSQRDRDINSSVVLKILSDLVCSGKIENNKESLLIEGRHWLELQGKLRL